MTDSQPATVPIPVAKRRGLLPLLIIAAIVVLAMAGAGAYLVTHRASSSLDRTDPVGALVCRHFRTWIDEDAKAGRPSPPDVRFLGAMKLADEAKGATTPGILAAAGGNIMDGPAAAPVVAAGGPSEFRVANLTQLHAACVAAGMSMPAYVEPTP